MTILQATHMTWVVQFHMLFVLITKSDISITSNKYAIIVCVKNFTFREIFKKIETAVRCLIQNWVYNINQLNFIGKVDERKIALIQLNELNLIECVISQLLCDCRHFLHAIEAGKKLFLKIIKSMTSGLLNNTTVESESLNCLCRLRYVCEDRKN